jgi:tRNA 2-thiouridine synthesizing protein A
VRSRAALAGLPASEPLVVLATDREAPIDLAALAADSGRGFVVEETDGIWRCTLG